MYPDPYGSYYPPQMSYGPQYSFADAEYYIGILAQYNQAVDDPSFDPLGWQRYYPVDDYFFNFDFGQTYPDQVQILYPEDPYRCQVYIGEVNAAGERHGFGVLYTCDCIRRGAFRFGEFCGWGREARSDGDVIIGRFEYGYLNGKGTYTNFKANLYEGDFIDSVREGYGDLTTNKFHYNGEFRDNRMEGRGRIEFLREGHTYEGDFRDNEINGYGLFRWKNGDIYEGSMVNGKMDGPGRYTYSNGQVFEGSYVNGVKVGQGRLIFPDGKIFEGNFRDGVPDGPGLICVNGQTNQVEFNMGKIIRSGNGYGIGQGLNAFASGYGTQPAF